MYNSLEPRIDLRRRSSFLSVNDLQGSLTPLFRVARVQFGWITGKLETSPPPPPRDK